MSPEAEGVQEKMEQAGVVGGSRILGGQLPVAVDALALKAEKPQGALAVALDDLYRHRPQVFLQRFHLIGEAREDNAVEGGNAQLGQAVPALVRSEEHTSELQSLMRISYAVFCLKKKTNSNKQNIT